MCFFIILRKLLLDRLFRRQSVGYAATYVQRFLISWQWGHFSLSLLMLVSLIYLPLRAHPHLDIIPPSLPLPRRLPAMKQIRTLYPSVEPIQFYSFSVQYPSISSIASSSSYKVLESEVQWYHDGGGDKNINKKKRIYKRQKISQY